MWVVDCTVMASAASPKRMVSSVFITLTSPYRATVTQQQQPALQAEQQHTAVRVSPSDSIPPVRHRKEPDVSPSGSYSSLNRTYAGPRSPRTAQPGSNGGKPQEADRGAAGLFHQSTYTADRRNGECLNPSLRCSSKFI